MLNSAPRRPCLTTWEEEDTQRRWISGRGTSSTASSLLTTSFPRWLSRSLSTSLGGSRSLQDLLPGLPGPGTRLSLSRGREGGSARQTKKENVLTFIVFLIVMFWSRWRLLFRRIYFYILKSYIGMTHWNLSILLFPCLNEIDKPVFMIKYEVLPQCIPA